jgi:hypothetical protein
MKSLIAAVFMLLVGCTLPVVAPGPGPSPSPSPSPVPTSTDTATLIWTPDANPDIQSYHVYISTTPGAASNPYSEMDVAPPSSSYQVTGLIAGVTYYFEIVAVDTSGLESGPSNEVSYTPQ